MDRIYYPTIFIDLSERVFHAYRSDLEETRKIVFSGRSSKGEELLAGNEKIATGAVTIHLGRHTHKDKDVIGLLSYLGTYSLDNDEHRDLSIEELLEMKAKHVQENGKSEPFPYEHLIQPHTFQIHLWVDQSIFDSLRVAELDRSKIIVALELNSQEESTISTSHWLTTRVTTWDVKKESKVSAKSYSVSIKSLEIGKPALLPAEDAPSELPTLHERLALIELEMAARIRSIEKTLFWCACFLLGIFVVLALKR